MRRPAVFFDRDNTLIVGSEYLGDPNGVVLVAGAPAAVAKCRAMGFAVVIVSNQSGVARGMFTEDDVRAVNRRMDQMLLEQNPAAVIDRHEYCPFHPDAKVDAYRQDSFTRKPKPGMVLAAADAMALDLTRSWMIGDAPRDIAAGKAAGCRTILIIDPTLTPSPAALEKAEVQADYVVGSLIEAVEIVVQHANREDPDALTPWDRPSHEPALPETAAAPVASPKQQPQHPPSTQKATTSSSDRPRTVVADLVGPIAAALVPAATTPQATTPPQSPATPTPASPPPSALQPSAPPPKPAARPAPAAPTAPAQPSPFTISSKPVAAPATTPARPAAAATPSRPAARPAGTPQSGASQAQRPAAAPGQSPASTPSKQDLSRLEAVNQQILMELKKLNEKSSDDFQISKLIAGITQILAIALVPLGYMLHRPDNAAELANWLLGAVFLQTFTIALLIMGRQR